MLLINKQGDRHNVSRPLARIQSTNQHTNTNNQGYLVQNSLSTINQVWLQTGIWLESYQP